MFANVTRTVFFAWQSDSPSGTNRGFIRDALDRAVKKLNDDGYDIAVDQGTEGVAGMPDISNEILRKIDKCAVFVADVTLVGTVDDVSGRLKRLSNPSVMYELGYARKRHGENLLVALINTAFGRVEDLPFDIKGARVSPYRRHSLAKDSDTKPAEVSGVLYDALKLVLDEPNPDKRTNEDLNPVEELKQLLSDTGGVNKVDSFVASKTEDLVTALADKDRFPVSSSQMTRDAHGIRYVADQVHRYVDACLPLCELLAVGVAFGSEHHENIWQRTIERVGNIASEERNGNTALLDLRCFPVLMLGYTVLIVGVARHKYGSIRAALLDAEIYDTFQHTRDATVKIPAVGWVHPWVPFENGNVVPSVAAIDASNSEPCSLEQITSLINRSQGRPRTPGSDILHEVLRKPLRLLIPDDRNFKETFDKSEVLLSLIAVDAQANTTTYLPDPAYGSFIWRYRHHQPPFEQSVIDNIRFTPLSGKLLAAGLFGGQKERLHFAIESVLTGAKEARSSWF